MPFTPTQEDKDILLQRHKKVFTKIERLNSAYQVVETIEGTISNGNLSVDATSDIRRTFNATFIINDATYTGEIDTKFWMDSYIRVYIGVENAITKNVVWYRQGLYCIQSNGFSYNATTKEVQISCVDLVAKLNDTLAGVIVNSEITFLAWDPVTYDSVNTTLAGAIEQTLNKLTGLDINQKVINCEPDAIIPYNMEYNSGTSVWKILCDLRDLYYTYEIFFDDNVLYFQKVPTGSNEGIYIEDDIINKLVISENTNVDYSTVRNVVEVVGTTFTTDLVTEKVTYDGAKNEYTLEIIGDVLRNHKYIKIPAGETNGNKANPTVVVKVSNQTEGTERVYSGPLNYYSITNEKKGIAANTIMSNKEYIIQYNGDSKAYVKTVKTTPNAKYLLFDAINVYVSICAMLGFSTRFTDGANYSSPYNVQSYTGSDKQDLIKQNPGYHDLLVEMCTDKNIVGAWKSEAYVQFADKRNDYWDGSFYGIDINEVLQSGYVPLFFNSGTAPSYNVSTTNNICVPSSVVKEVARFLFNKGLYDYDYLNLSDQYDQTIYSQTTTRKLKYRSFGVLTNSLFFRTYSSRFVRSSGNVQLFDWGKYDGKLSGFKDYDYILTPDQKAYINSIFDKETFVLTDLTTTFKEENTIPHIRELANSNFGANMFDNYITVRPVSGSEKHVESFINEYGAYAANHYDCDVSAYLPAGVRMLASERTNSNFAIPLIQRNGYVSLTNRSYGNYTIEGGFQFDGYRIRLTSNESEPTFFNMLVTDENYFSNTVGVDYQKDTANASNTYWYGVAKLESMGSKDAAYTGGPPQFVFMGQTTSRAVVKLYDSMPSQSEKDADIAEENCSNIEYVVGDGAVYQSPYSVQKIGKRVKSITDTNIITDELAMARAKMELYNCARLTDTIQLQSILIPWLDVNKVATYATQYNGATEPIKYMIKNFSMNLGEYTMNITMSKYYPDFQEA